ncbi:uncharacterized protein N7529_001195 [Penicillium soppii]|jgi:hypothetical protein|uniref:uncharacterized protein n=1 Tax=Penicillium soppii TaxID=69789 RepID=UPI002549ADD4|nr:uncharacterized protein N7529_001195 [Penicillium soppii]KAJ5882523.1 hypothetical protein N7529_001195 [Penicillium soppii]
MERDSKFAIPQYKKWIEASKLEDVMLGAIIANPLRQSADYAPGHPFVNYNPQIRKTTERDATDKFDLLTGMIAECPIAGNIEDIIHLTGKFIGYKRIHQLDEN